jgi:hypothetical protein
MNTVWHIPLAALRKLYIYFRCTGKGDSAIIFCSALGTYWPNSEFPKCPHHSAIGGKPDSGKAFSTLGEIE